jgi:D-alanyl-D-alanine carboxypeptidase
LKSLRLLPLFVLLAGIIMGLVAIPSFKFQGIEGTSSKARATGSYIFYADVICTDHKLDRKWKCVEVVCDSEDPNSICKAGDDYCQDRDFCTWVYENERYVPYGSEDDCISLHSLQNPSVCEVPTPSECDYDTSVYNGKVPDRNLNDKHLNPEMRRALDAALYAAKQAGFNPKIGEAYRSPERSDSLYQAYISGKGGRAAPAWGSPHNYGIAVDILLINSAGKIIPNNANNDYTDFAQFMKAEGFEWFGDYHTGDDGHFEYHPAKTGLMSGAELKALRDKVIKEMGLMDIRCTEWRSQLWQNLR